MAEGPAQYLRGDHFAVYSAGVEKHGLNPLAVNTMEQISIGISHHQSETIDDIQDMKFDYVITVCDNAQKTCPCFPVTPEMVCRNFDAPKLAEKEPDPAKQMQHYQRVRDEIKEYVLRLPDST